MSQISRPFQVALLAIAVLAAAWLFVFQPHPSSTTSPAGSSAVVSSPTPAASSSAAAEAKAAASPTPIYHGSAPGVQGLSRAIAKAHGAVAQSQQNANQLQEKSAQASGQAPATGANAASSSTGTPAQTASSSASATPTTVQPGKSASAPASKVTSKPHAAHALPGTPAGQRKVESELARGNVVVVLFWNPKGVEDVAVHKELQLLLSVHHRLQPLSSNPLVKRLSKAFGLELEKKIAVNEASAGQTASFGSITRSLQIYGTPTLLMIGKQGKTIVLSGLQDAFSIQQSIDEARHA